MSLNDKIFLTYAGQLAELSTAEFGEQNGELALGAPCPELGDQALVEDFPGSKLGVQALHVAALASQGVLVDFSAAPLPAHAAFLARRAQSLWSNPFWRAKGFSRLALAGQWRAERALNRQNALAQAVHDWRMVEDEATRDPASNSIKALFGTFRAPQAKINVDGRDLETLMRDLGDACNRHAQHDLRWVDDRLTQALRPARDGAVRGGAWPSCFLLQSIEPSAQSEEAARDHAWLAGFNSSNLMSPPWSQRFEEPQPSDPGMSIHSAPNPSPFPSSVGRLAEEARVPELCSLLREQPELRSSLEIRQLIGSLAASRIFAPELASLLLAGAQPPLHLAHGPHARVEFWVGLALMGWAPEALLEIAAFCPPIQEPLPYALALPVFAPVRALLNFDVVSFLAPGSDLTGAQARAEGFDWALRAALDGYETDLEGVRLWLGLGADPSRAPRPEWSVRGDDEKKTSLALAADRLLTDQRHAISALSSGPGAMERAARFLLERSAGHSWQTEAIAQFSPIRALGPDLARLEADAISEGLPAASVDRAPSRPPRSL